MSRVVNSAAIEGRLMMGTSFEFQRAVAQANAQPASASECAARATALAIAEATTADNERVYRLTIDRIKRLEQAWVISKGTDSIIRG